MKERKWGLIFLLMLALFSCSKNSYSVEKCEKIPLPTVFTQPGGQHIYWDLKGADYRVLEINPINGKELLILQLFVVDSIIDDTLRQYLTGGFFLYNLESKKKTLIPDLVNVQHLSWVGDWVVFSKVRASSVLEADIWKLNIRTGELVQLTWTGLDFNPEWNKDGSLFIYQHGFDDDNIIADNLGNNLDTVNYVNSKVWAWEDEIILEKDFSSIWIANPQTGLHEKMVDENFISDIKGRKTLGEAHWLGSQHFLWSLIDVGMFVTNRNTKETIRLFDMCDARYYVQPAYSATLGKLFFIRRDVKLTDTIYNLEGLRHTNVVMTNLDGTGEQILDIPVGW